MFRDYATRSGAIIANLFPIEKRVATSSDSKRGRASDCNPSAATGLFKATASPVAGRLSLRLCRVRLDVFDFTLPPVGLCLAAWTLDGVRSYLAVISEILPSRLVAVVVIHGAGSVRIGPIPFVFIAVPWGTAELLFGYVRTIAANARVIFQRLPRQGLA